MPRKKCAAGDLVMVEAPATAKTIERHPGPGCHVTARDGHARDLPKGKLGVDMGG